MKILIPVDGSEPALDAVRHALSLYHNGLKASFVLATVQVPVYLYELMLPPDADVLERVTGAEGGKALASAEDLFKVAGVPYEREIGSGDPAQTLIVLARQHGCDAIIMGARGMGALRSTLLGSVSQRVMHEAALPVTIVKHHRAGVPGQSAGG